MEKPTIVFRWNMLRERRIELSHVLQVRVEDNHNLYLGLPTLVGRSKNAVFDGIREKLWNKTLVWKEKFVSQVGKMIFIKAVLQ